MMQLKKRSAVFTICLLASAFIATGCAGFNPSKIVDINREKYVCKIDPTRFSNLKGRRILLSTIIDKSTNTSNLFYYNPEKTIGYALYYSSSTMQQPVVSFYWYALKKGFECAGIRIEEHGPVYDAELSLAFYSLTDEELKFEAALTKSGRLCYAKDYTVSTPRIKTEDPNILEQRAYGMLDTIVVTVLSDTDFQNAFEKKETPINVYETKKYQNIKGIVLRNGTVVTGEIVSMSTEQVQIRTGEGKILSYSFKDEVESFITR